MTRRAFASTMCCLPLSANEQERRVKSGLEPVTPRQALTAANGRRRAFLIGNNRYTKAPKLHNASHDASDLTEALQRLRFDAQVALDADLVALRKSVQEFCSGLQNGDITFFFYSGHGLQIDEVNYLVPTDFDPTRGESGAETSCLAASEVKDAIQHSGAAMCVFVLDACRDNPFRMGQSPPKGFALMDAGLGTYIALATGPGQTASDNSSERNGLFTKYLLREIARAGLSIDQIFASVKKQVFEASQQTQRPWLHSEVIGDFFFSGSDLVLRPSSGSTLIETGRRQFEAGQFDGARKSFEQAQRVEPDNAFIYNALGAAHMQLKQWSVAVGLFSKAIELKPDYAAAYFNRGAAYHNTGRYELAVQDFSWAIDEEAYDPLPFDLRGKAYFSLLDYDNAKADFDRALELNPTDSTAFLGRGKILFRKARFAEAISDLTSSITIHQTSEAYEIRAQANRAMNRLTQAEADHQAALKLQR